MRAKAVAFLAALLRVGASAAPAKAARAVRRVGVAEISIQSSIPTSTGGWDVHTVYAPRAVTGNADNQELQRLGSGVFHGMGLAQLDRNRIAGVDGRCFRGHGDGAAAVHHVVELAHLAMQ